MVSDDKSVVVNPVKQELTDEGLEMTFATEAEAQKVYNRLKEHDNVRLDGNKVISIMKKEHRRELWSQ